MKHVQSATKSPYSSRLATFSANTGSTYEPQKDHTIHEKNPQIVSIIIIFGIKIELKRYALIKVASEHKVTME